MKTGNILKTGLSTICLAGMLAAVGTANADIITFDLSTGNSAISGYTGPYASVTVDLTSSTTANITFTALSGGGHQFLLVDGGSAAVNVHASSWTLSNLGYTQIGSGFVESAGDLSDGGAGNEDGFGSFNQTLNNFDSFKHALATISFTLTDTSGTWANAAAVLLGNTHNAEAAAHIAVTSFPAIQANGALSTGFAAGNESGTDIPVPDGGSTVALLGFGLLGIGALRQRLSRK